MDPRRNDRNENTYVSLTEKIGFGVHGKKHSKTNDALKLQNYLAITHAIEMIQVIRF